MGHGVGGGTDVVKVQLGQFMPLRVMPYGELTLMIYPGLIRVVDSFILLADTNDSGKPVPKTFSVEEHSYVDDGKSAYVLVTIDTSGEIITTKGDEVDTESLALTDIPSIPEGTQYVLAAVRLYSGITEIQENREATDIVDLRFPMPHNHASDGISEIDWGSIDFTGSDISDLTTKSHTSLTDIGTLTHAELEIVIGGKADTVHTHVEDDITNLDHNAEKIDGIAVDLTGITDGQIIKYDSGTSKLVVGTQSGGSGTLPGVEIDCGSFATDTADIDAGGFA
jgi:hypothetical protein